MNPLASELNQIIERGNPSLLKMLSDVGRQLFFPKGILSQSAEAKEKAHRINATIGIAKETGHTMRFDTIMTSLHGVKASESLTYAPSFGIPALRKRWREELYAKNPSLQGKDFSLPVATCGITHAISTFADMWVDPGDVIITPDMMWGNYNMIFSVRNGARISHFPLFDDNGGFNVLGLHDTALREIKSRAKIIVLLNFPQNPTGYTISRDEADALTDVLLNLAEGGTQVLVALDDSYFGLFYEEQTLKESLFARLCGLHPNLLAVKLDGATKEYFVWGLRIGFITYGIPCPQGDPAEGYLALEKKTAGSVRGSISNAPHLSQTILLHSMDHPANPSEKEEKFKILKARAEKVREVVAASKYQRAFRAYPFNSGYFMCLRLKTVDAETLRVHLLDQYAVGLIALGKHDLRVAFSCIDEDQIETLFDIILKGIKDLETSDG